MKAELKLFNIKFEAPLQIALKSSKTIENYLYSI